MLVTLAEAKLHLRVNQSSEDSLIEMYIEAAGDMIEKYLNQPAPAVPAVRAAALLMVAGLYENREDVITGTIVEDNPTVVRLLYPYRECIGL
jgi:uncharacterized phage protein (predicted DNA packaging)